VLAARVVDGLAAQPGDELGGVAHERRLTGLAPVRHWGEERAVGFDQQRSQEFPVQIPAVHGHS
jgi:hypothetical protein